MTSDPLCPICQQRVRSEDPQFPFCSERCRNVDLFRWWNGKYAIAEPLRPEHLDGELGERLEDLLDQP